MAVSRILAQYVLLSNLIVGISFAFKSCTAHNMVPRASLLMFPDVSSIVTSTGTDITAYQPFLMLFKSSFDVGINFFSVCFILRTILSWYPSKDLRKLPYSLVVLPTEFLQKPVRKLVPPAFGVDISAIIWIMILSFLHEVLTGQQGIVTMLLKK